MLKGGRRCAEPALLQFSSVHFGLGENDWAISRCRVNSQNFHKVGDLAQMAESVARRLVIPPAESPHKKRIPKACLASAAIRFCSG